MVKAILAEIQSALENLAKSGETHTLFINKMGLNQQDREAIHEYLGQGSVRIKLENTDEPAEWLESGVCGVWLGVFLDHNDRPLLETIEITRFPSIAAAQIEDIQSGAAQLRKCIEEMD